MCGIKIGQVACKAIMILLSAAESGSPISDEEEAVDRRQRH